MASSRRSSAGARRRPASWPGCAASSLPRRRSRLRHRLTTARRTYQLGPLGLAEPPPGGEGPQERLLDDLLGGRGVAEEEGGQAAEAPVVLAEDGLEQPARLGDPRSAASVTGSSSARTASEHTFTDARGPRRVVSAASSGSTAAAAEARQWGDEDRRGRRPRRPAPAHLGHRARPSWPSGGWPGPPCGTWPPPPASTWPPSTTTSPPSRTSWWRCWPSGASWTRSPSPPRRPGERTPADPARRPPERAPPVDARGRGLHPPDARRGHAQRRDRAQSSGTSSSAGTQAALEHWIAEDQPRAGRGPGADAVARMLRAMLIGLFFEHVAGVLGGEDRRAAPAGPGRGGGGHLAPRAAEGARSGPDEGHPQAALAVGALWGGAPRCPGSSPSRRGPGSPRGSWATLSATAVGEGDLADRVGEHRPLERGAARVATRRAGARARGWRSRPADSTAPQGAGARRSRARPAPRRPRRCRRGGPPRSRVADVVVALEQDDVVGGQAAADADRLGDAPRSPASRGSVATTGVVSTPTSMAPSPSHLAMRTPRRRADVADHRAEGRQERHGALVPLDLGQGGEPRQVHEGEATVDPHTPIVSRRGPSGHPSAGTVPLDAGRAAEDHRRGRAAAPTAEPSNDHPPAVEHDRPVGQREGPVGLLLDDQEGRRRPRAARPAARRRSSSGGRRQPERELVGHEDARARRPATLASESRRCWPPESVPARWRRRSASIGEGVVGAARAPPATAAARASEEGELQVLVDGQVGEDSRGPRARDATRARAIRQGGAPVRSAPPTAAARARADQARRTPGRSSTCRPRWGRRARPPRRRGPRRTRRRGPGRGRRRPRRAVELEAALTRPARGRPGGPSGSAMTAAKVPSAMTRPRSSTTTRSAQRARPVARSCSTSSTAIPRSRGSRSTVASVADSDRRAPRTARRPGGRTARRRGPGRSRRSRQAPSGSVDTGASARSARPHEAQHLVDAPGLGGARAAPARPARATASGRRRRARSATSRCVAHGQLAGTPRPAGRSGRSRGAPVGTGRSPSRRTPPSVHRAGRRLSARRRR